MTAQTGFVRLMHDGRAIPPASPGREVHPMRELRQGAEMSDIDDLCQIIHRGIGLNFEDLAEEIIAAGFHRDRTITIDGTEATE